MRDDDPPAPSPSSNDVNSDDSKDSENGFGCIMDDATSIIESTLGSTIDLNPADRRAFMGEPVNNLLTASVDDAISTSEGDHVSSGASSCSEEEGAGDLNGDFFLADDASIREELAPFGSNCSEIPAKTLA